MIFVTVKSRFIFSAQYLEFCGYLELYKLDKITKFLLNTFKTMPARPSNTLTWRCQPLEQDFLYEKNSDLK